MVAPPGVLFLVPPSLEVTHQSPPGVLLVVPPSRSASDPSPINRLDRWRSSSWMWRVLRSYSISSVFGWELVKAKQILQVQIWHMVYVILYLIAPSDQNPWHRGLSTEELFFPWSPPHLAVFF